MEAAIERKQRLFRLRTDLLGRLERVAQQENTSVDSLVEEVLMDFTCSVPNEETRAAIEEARSGKYAGTLDVSSFEAFMKSVNAIE